MTTNFVAESHTHLLLYTLGGQKSKRGFTGLNQGVGRAALLLELLEENLFPASRGCPRSLACGLFPQLCWSDLCILTFSLTQVPPSYRDSCDYPGPTQIT